METLLQNKKLLVPPLIVALVIAVGSTLIILLTGGPESGSSGTSAAAPAGGSGSGDAVEIKTFKFNPTPLQVSAGTSVTFTNEDSAAHTATSDDKTFDTGTLNQGDSKTVKLDKPGTYTYICQFHQYMHGEIDVK